MKASLTFNLPEQQEEFDMAYNGQAYYAILVELDNKLRDLHKYQDQEMIKISEVREMMVSMAHDWNVKI